MSKKLIDISGNRYGRLAVKSYVGNEKWECLCDCGNITFARGGNLRGGITKSCGCLSKEVQEIKAQENATDIVGRKFGNLTVESLESTKDRMYKCRCVCGNYRMIKRRYLLDGSAKSCGCKNIKDMTGMKFGRLQVLRQNGLSKKGEAVWECKCNCGNVVNVAGYQLRSGNVSSCGCLHREVSHIIHKKYNNYRAVENYVEVLLPNNQIMKCDEEDWYLWKEHYWRVGNNGYACSNAFEEDKGTIYFHQLVIDCPDGMVRDHINRDRLDNRRCNLRIVSPRRNSLNSGMNKNNTSGVKGVYRSRNKWVAQIVSNGKNHYLGSYDSIEEASDVRRKAEIEYFGE
ncbi:MAG: HNH endonuclease [Lachnospiraceae bacterium]|nr:HNH endonuclease [Lachnospiraceae bacterium]